MLFSTRWSSFDAAPPRTRSRPRLTRPIPRRRRAAGARTRRMTATSTARTVGRSPRLRVLVGQPRARPRGAGLDTSSKHKANKTPPYPGGAKRSRRSMSEYRPTKSAERPAHSAPRPCHQCPTIKPVMKITTCTSARWSRFVLNDHSSKATTEKKRPKTKSAGRQPNRAKRAAYRPVQLVGRFD